MAAYLRVTRSQGHHLAAACRSRAPSFLCSSPNIAFKSHFNLEDGCFSPHNHCYPPPSCLQQQRQYASVGGAVRKAGAGWFRRKLYTLLIVAGVSGGALIYVSHSRVVGIILGLLLHALQTNNMIWSIYPLVTLKLTNWLKYDDQLTLSPVIGCITVTAVISVTCIGLSGKWAQSH